jgi:hypothetical protein
VNQTAGRLVEGLDAQAYAARPAFPAGKEEGFVRGFRVGLHGDLLRPGGKKGPEAGQEALYAGGAQDGRGAASQVQGGNPAYGETGQPVPNAGKKGAYTCVKPGVLRTDRNGVEVTVAAGSGAEGNVEVEGRFHPLILPLEPENCNGMVQPGVPKVHRS